MEVACTDDKIMTMEIRRQLKDEQRVRFLFDPEAKQATRPLYEQTFPDSRAYVDFYYAEKCRDNVVVVKEELPQSGDTAWQGSCDFAEKCPDNVVVKEDPTRLESENQKVPAGNEDREAFDTTDVVEQRQKGEEDARISDHPSILAMAHLNPYLLRVRDRQVRTYLVAAVATVPRRRRQGHMRDILAAAFRWLEEQGVPFIMLLPVDPAIYESFGFEPICPFTEQEPASEVLAREYDVHIFPDPPTQRRRALARAVEEAARAAGEQDEDWPADPIIMARVTNAAAFDSMAGQAFESDTHRLAWLRSLRICISEGV